MKLNEQKCKPPTNDAASSTVAADEKRRQIEDIADTPIVESDQSVKTRTRDEVETPRHPASSKEQFLQRELASFRKFTDESPKEGNYGTED